MPAIVVVLMVAVGGSLRPVDFRRVREQPAVVLAGVIAPLVLLPALALLLIAWWNPPAATVSGMLIVAVCPIGGLSNVYVHLARASVALSVTLTGLSCLLAAVTIPALGAAVGAVLRRDLGLEAPLPLLVAQVLGMLVLPISLGMWVRHARPDLVERHGLALRRAGVVALVILIALIAATDPGRFLDDLGATAPLAATFVAGSFAAGWLTGLVVRAGIDDRFTLASEFATRNVAVATAIAVTLLHRVEFATFGTTYVLIEGPLMLIAALLWRTRPAAVAVPA